MSPGGDLLLGGDYLGRDIASRLVYGTRVTLGLALAISALAFLIGSATGFVAAVRGGWVDSVPSRVVDALISFPAIMIALIVGGERQRVNLARAQAILDLLRDLQERLEVGYLFISHDISTIARIADTVAVMQNGEIVEYGSTGTVLTPHHHPHTELLLRSVPDMRTDGLDTLEPLAGGGSARWH